MTVRINFLPRNFQPPRQMGAKEVAIASAVGAACVAAGVFYMSVYTGTNRLEEQTVADQARLQTVRVQLAQAAELKAREEAVTKAEMELKSLSGRRWSGVMLTMRELTPQGVTWKKVSVKGDTIILTGNTNGLVDLAQLFGGLVDHSDVDQIALKYYDEKGREVVFAKSGEKQVTTPQPQALPQGNQPDAKPEITQVRVKELEFELSVTLKPAEGRQPTHGA